MTSVEALPSSPSRRVCFMDASMLGIAIRGHTAILPFLRLGGKFPRRNQLLPLAIGRLVLLLGPVRFEGNALPLRHEAHEMPGGEIANRRLVVGEILDQHLEGLGPAKVVGVEAVK